MEDKNFFIQKEGSVRINILEKTKMYYDYYYTCYLYKIHDEQTGKTGKTGKTEKTPSLKDNSDKNSKTKQDKIRKVIQKAYKFLYNLITYTNNDNFSLYINNKYDIRYYTDDKMLFCITDTKGKLISEKKISIENIETLFSDIQLDTIDIKLWNIKDGIYFELLKPYYANGVVVWRSE